MELSRPSRSPESSTRRRLPGLLAVLMASLPLAVSPQTAGVAAVPVSYDVAPDGHIPLATLREATLDVPAWPADDVQCTSGRLRFHDGSSPVPPHPVPDGQPPYGDSVLILGATYGDVDHDGADETVALLGCMIEGGSKQLVAYDRDRAGHIVPLGQVTVTTGPIRDIRDASPRFSPAGVVTALVGDYQRCCADRTPQIWQTRGYALRDGRFEQVSGPDRMPVNRHVTDLQVTTGDLELGPATGGYRTGGVDVTITHRHGAHPSKVTVWFYAPPGLERTGPGWPPVITRPESFGVTVAAPAAGGSVTHRFTFRQRATTAGSELPVEIIPVPAMSPAVPWSTSATVQIRTTH
ncbi:hypothetical protein [Actinoplanes sp. L3-i22]|uniref:hypothetical protein n=1 Tax=Actinoplanes sp. L3-i22 TaxID=2836373 RepID=UPI001C743DFC|nr:hypothetical protein [Actinoplanes sp. L3-i22]BCY12090.1 hypothetical protein L3i22_071780 [Actinoplanes sp. L3-i22]